MLKTCGHCGGSYDAGAQGTAACPCGGVPGRGVVACGACGHRFAASMPHLSVGCNLTNEPCPACGQRVIHACVC